MARHHSRLLQLVVAGLLLGPVADATATTYDDYPIAGVPGSGFFGGSSTTWAYYGGYTELLLNDFDYSYGGGGGGGGSFTDSEIINAVCAAITGAVPESCDLLNPPKFSTNGCGGGIFTNIVPDYLMVNGTLVTRLGPIFSEACNRHDYCYSTSIDGKDQCDARLGSDMVDRAKEALTPTQWGYYEQHVRFQAALYNTALQTQPSLTVANYLFSSAQADEACRKSAASAESSGCNN